MEWEQIERMSAELTSGQKARLLKEAHRLLPHLIQDDLLQPNDFPVLENDPEFRYEEGVLAGMHAFFMALRAEKDYLSD